MAAETFARCQEGTNETKKTRVSCGQLGDKGRCGAMQRECSVLSRARFGSEGTTKGRWKPWKMPVVGSMATASSRPPCRVQGVV